MGILSAQPNLLTRSFGLCITPTALARERTANITVTFVSNPTTGATSTQTRELCGEGVHTGARVLVTQGGVPMAQVHEIELKRVRGGFLGFDKEVDEVKNALLQTVPSAPGTACASFQFHREYGGVTNPTQLRPSVYQLKVEAKIAGKEVCKRFFSTCRLVASTARSSSTSSDWRALKRCVGRVEGDRLSC